MTTRDTYENSAAFNAFNDEVDALAKRYLEVMMSHLNRDFPHYEAVFAERAEEIGNFICCYKPGYFILIAGGEFDAFSLPYLVSSQYVIDAFFYAVVRGHTSTIYELYHSIMTSLHNNKVIYDLNNGLSVGTIFNMDFLGNKLVCSYFNPFDKIFRDAIIDNPFGTTDARKILNILVDSVRAIELPYLYFYELFCRLTGVAEDSLAATVVTNSKNGHRYALFYDRLVELDGTDDERLVKNYRVSGQTPLYCAAVSVKRLAHIRRYMFMSDSLASIATNLLKMQIL